MSFRKIALLVLGLIVYFGAMAAIFLYFSKAFGIIIAIVIAYVLVEFTEILAFVNWRDKSKSYDPEILLITEPFQKVGDRLETKVKMHGEVWRAVLAEHARQVPAVGQAVRIVGRNGLTLKVDAVKNGA